MKIRYFFSLAVLLCCSTASAYAQFSTTADSIHTVTLEEVQVSALKKDSRRLALDFFRSNRNATLEELLSRLPELNFTRRGPYGMEPMLRNFRDGQINVLVDGMRMQGACTDKMDPVTIYIEPVNLEQVEVKTAASGNLQGTSLGGTINFRLASPDTSTRWSALLQNGYQSAAYAHNHSLVLNHSHGNWAFRASGTLRQAAEYRAGKGILVPFSDYRKANTSFSARYQYDAYNYLKLDVLYDEGHHIGYPALPMDVGLARAGILALTLVHEPHHKMNWNLKLYHNAVHHEMDDTRRPATGMHMDMPGQSLTTGLLATTELKTNRTNRFLLTADLSSTFLKASMTMYENGQPPMYMLTWPENRKWQTGIGIAWISKPDSITQLQVNLRADHIRHLLTSTEGKAAWSVFNQTASSMSRLLGSGGIQLNRLLAPAWLLSSSISVTQRIPTAGEFFGIYLFNANDGFDYMGNPQLKSETALQEELTLQYARRKNRIRVTLSHAAIGHYITGRVQPGLSTMTIGATGVKQWENNGRANIWNLEGSSNWIIGGILNWVNTIRFSYGKLQDGNPVPQLAPFKYIGAVRIPLGAFSAGMETECAAAQKRFNRASGEDATGAYAILHIRMAYRFTVGKLINEFQLGCENLLDAQYHEHLDWGNLPRQGRNIYCTLVTRF